MNIFSTAARRSIKKVLEAMVGEVMTALTGEKERKKAWLKLFSPKDVVGLVPTSVMNPTHNELLNTVQDSCWRSVCPKAKSGWPGAELGTEAESWL